jgi:hypothetical protein
VVLDLLEELARWQTPAPEGFGVFREEYGEVLSAWSRLPLDPPSDLDDWAHGHLDELTA